MKQLSKVEDNESYEDLPPMGKWDWLLFLFFVIPWILGLGVIGIFLIEVLDI